MKCCAYSFQVGTFRTFFRVNNESLCPKQYTVVDNHVVTE